MSNINQILFRKKCKMYTEILLCVIMLDCTSVKGILLNVAYKKPFFTNGKSIFSPTACVDGNFSNLAYASNFPTNETAYWGVNLKKVHHVLYIIIHLPNQHPGIQSGASKDRLNLTMEKFSIEYSMKVEDRKFCNSYFGSLIPAHPLKITCERDKNIEAEFVYVIANRTRYKNEDIVIGMSEIEIVSRVSSSEVDIAQSQTVYTRKGRIQASFYVFTTGTGQNVLFKAQWFYVLLENFYPIFRVVLKTWNVLKGKEHPLDYFIVRLLNAKFSRQLPAIVRFFPICNQYKSEARKIMEVVCIRSSNAYRGVLIHKANNRKDFEHFYLTKIEVYMKEYNAKEGFMGCYHSPKYLTLVSENIRTVEECLVQCENHKNTYAAITEKTACYCTDVLDLRKVLKLHLCSDTCELDENPCGGYRKYNFYATDQRRNVNHLFVGCFAGSKSRRRRVFSKNSVKVCSDYCIGYSTPYFSLQEDICSCMFTFFSPRSCKNNQAEKIHKVYKYCYEFGKYFSSCDKKVHNCAVGNLRNQFECEVPECADGWKGNACLDSACYSNELLCKGECRITNKGDIVFEDCQCPAGLLKSYHHSKHCDTDRDECKEGLCGGMSFDCINTVGSYICLCKNGFKTYKGTCTDINECRWDDMCSEENTICSNLAGSYECICKPGYNRLDGVCTNDLYNTRKGSLNIKLKTFAKISGIITTVLVLACLIYTVKNTKALHEVVNRNPSTNTVEPTNQEYT